MKATWDACLLVSSGLILLSYNLYIYNRVQNRSWHEANRLLLLMVLKLICMTVCTNTYKININLCLLNISLIAWHR
ncbi:hypothetical protein XENTR_v10005452 [Xenopus tropicalis]|nr:hypothetical protein XENTR_v10005452 [Xenopus tropicalis]